MNKDWQTFLSTHNLLSSNHKYAASIDWRNADLLCDLSNMSVIRVQGPDARSFLHSQFSNNINQVSESQSVLSSYCTSRGRMLAIFYVFLHHQELHLCLSSELEDQIVNRLKMFVLRAKVTFENMNNRLVSIGISGPNTKNLISNIIKDIATEPYQTTQALGCTSIYVPSIHSRYLIVGSVDAIKNIWSELAPQTTCCTSDAWDLQDIYAGIPTISARIIEAFIPQMTNLDLIGGINFEKGCYPGQEVVARTHYLGTLKRRMFHIFIHTKNIPQSGDLLFDNNDNALPIGKIVKAQKDRDGVSALAVMQIAELQNPNLYWTGDPAAKIELQKLPYSLEAITK